MSPLTFIFAVLLPIFGQFSYQSTLTKHQWFCLTLYNFHGATIKIKGSLLMNIHIVKPFWREKLAGSRDL